MRQYKPADFIVMGVYRYYEKKVRHRIPEIEDERGKIVSNPEWTRDVIVTHLMYVCTRFVCGLLLRRTYGLLCICRFDARPEWSGIFSQACTMMLRGLVLKANDMVVDKLTQRLDGDAAKMLCDFVDRINRHQRDSLNNNLLEMKVKSGGVFAGKLSAAKRRGHRSSGGGEAGE